MSGIRIRCEWQRFIYGQYSPVHPPAVQYAYRRLDVDIVGKSYESEAPRFTGHSVMHHLNRFDAESAGLHP